MLLYVRGRVDATRDDLMTAAADGLLMKRRQTDDSMLEEVALSRFYADNVVIETKAIEMKWMEDGVHANYNIFFRKRKIICSSGRKWMWRESKKILALRFLSPLPPGAVRDERRPSRDARALLASLFSRAAQSPVVGVASYYSLHIPILRWVTSHHSPL